MTPPLVSVVIPLFNRVDLIAETLLSLQNQTYSNWEAIVVDDGSTDGSIQIVEMYANKLRCVRLIRRDTLAKGASVCRNIGIQNAKGDYLIFLDSDDLLGSNCIGKRIDFFVRNPSLDFAVFSTLVFTKTIYDTNIYFNVKTAESDLLRFLNMDIPWHTCSVIWKRKSIIDLDNWEETLLSWQDWHLHIKAITKGLKYDWVSACPDSYIRSHANTIGSHSTSTSHLHSHIRLLSMIEPLLNKTDPAIRKRLVGLYYWVSNQWLLKGDIKMASKVWFLTISKALVPSHAYLLILFYIKFYNSSFVRRRLVRYINFFWKPYVKKFEGNFKKVKFTPID